MAGFQVLTVSQLCRYVKSLLEEQRQLEDVMVKGEVSNLSFKQMSGHLYFSIRDEGGLVRCVMFSRYVQNLPEIPENGAFVLVRGAATLYERDGAFQLMVYDIQPLGAGQGKQDMDALKRRLQGEGLFDPARKRPLPPFPDTIGVITSREGAALQDIIRSFRRRGYGGRLILYPCLVQGAGAPASVLRALDAMERENLCQAAVIARGGGSSEDLSAFNDEELARRVYRCRVPVVSAVGHEVDFTILDLVADARAATPTAAGELMAPHRDALAQRVNTLREAIQSRAREQLRRQRQRLDQDIRLLSAASPRERVKKNRQRLDYLVRLLVDAQRHRTQALRGRTLSLVRQLELLNPAAVMRKGWSVATLEGKVLTTVAEVTEGQRLTTILADGEVISVVQSYHRKGEAYAEETGS